LQLVAFYSIIAKEQPPSESFLIRTDPVAERGLGRLQQQRIRELQKQILESAALSEFLSGIFQRQHGTGSRNCTKF